MKTVKLEIGLLGLVLLGLIGIPARAVPYSYLDTGLSTQGTPRVSASASASSGSVLAGWGPALVYDISSGTVTDLGNPAGAINPGVNMWPDGGITNDGFVAADTITAADYAWFYDPGTASWTRTSDSKDWVNKVNQTHAVGDDWTAPFTYEFATGTWTRYSARPEGAGIIRAAINNNNDIVARREDGTGSYLLTSLSPEIWDPTLLPILSTDINDSRLIAGEDPVLGASQGLVYDYNTGISTLIPFLPGKDRIATRSINNSGVVIGEQYLSTNESGSREAFIWDAANGVRNLNDPSVTSNLPNPAVDYLVWAGQISDNGVIVAKTWLSKLAVLKPEAVVPTPKNRGDVTEDLFVGADDLVRILTHWGESGSVPWENGDIAPYGDGTNPGDDFVGADDYVEVLTYWGTSYPAEPGEAVPEPAAMGVLLLGGLALLRNKRR